MKVAIVGPSAVGKSAYIHRLITGVFPSCERESNTLNLDTSHGKLPITLVESREPVECDLLVIMITSGSQVSPLLETKVGNPKVVIVESATSTEGETTCLRDWIGSGYPLYQVNAKTNYNFEKPLVEAAKLKFGPEVKVI